MCRLLNITQALADENRVRILACLRDGELCVCQITELLGIAPSTTSKHLAILRQAGLIESRKDGRWIHCRLPDPTAPAVVRDALALVLRAAADEARIVEDRRRLRSILRLEPAKLCLTQRMGESCCPPPTARRRARRTHVRSQKQREAYR